jgi:hypothetical protein
VIPHPRYDDPGGEGPNDIALVELEAPVPDVDPISIHRARLEPRLGASLTYVGFGAARSNGGGSGRKRSTTLTLQSVLPAVYVTEQTGGGVCFGDSGGPGLLDVGGDQLRVIGVNSTVFGNPSCEQYSTQIRVDAHQTWLDRVMGLDPRGCLDDRGRCQCAAACDADGLCDDSLCGLRGCVDISRCLGFCRDQLCAVSCFLNAAPEARYLYEALSGCARRECPGGGGACLSERCRREVFGCENGLAAVTGTAACGDLYRCEARCADGDVGCVDRCFYEGTLAAQARRGRIDDCREAACPDEDAGCVARACRDALLSCLPDEACALTGGDCPPGRACHPEPWSARYCRPSSGVPVGAPCAAPDACVDGALCVAGSCREVCASARDCEEGYPPCLPRAPQGVAFSVGVCSLDCPDGDGDGACDDADCDPWNPARAPGLDEACDPAAVDEDCDGARNEGCSVAADAGPSPDLGRADGGVGAPPDPEIPFDASSGGCRCALAPEAPPRPSPLPVFAVALALLVTRRRR